MSPLRPRTKRQAKQLLGFAREGVRHWTKQSRLWRERAEAAERDLPLAMQEADDQRARAEAAERERDEAMRIARDSAFVLTNTGLDDRARAEAAEAKLAALTPPPDAERYAPSGEYACKPCKCVGYWDRDECCDCYDARTAPEPMTPEEQVQCDAEFAKFEAWKAERERRSPENFAKLEARVEAAEAKVTAMGAL